MKADRLLTGVEAAITGFLLGFSALACLSTAFPMPLVDLWELAMYCALAAVLCGMCCSFRLGLIPLGILALAAGFLWKSGILVEGLEALLNKLTRVYHSGYGWNIIRWSHRTAEEMEVTLPSMIYILGALLSGLGAWTVSKAQSSIIACVPACLPVVCCFVVTDTLPNMVCLFLFLICITLLMLTSTVRQTDPAQGRKLAALAFLPVCLAVGLLFLAVPQQSYNGQQRAQTLSDTLFGQSPLERLWEELTGQTVIIAPGMDTKSVDLSKVGVRGNAKAEAMQVTAGYTGNLYLRGRALDLYTGTQWQDGGEDLQALYWPQRAQLTSVGEVRIATRYAHGMLYLPYYTRSIDMTQITRGTDNDKKLSQYSFTCDRLASEDILKALYPSPYHYYFDGGSTSAPCTELPAETLAWAKPLADEIVGDYQSPYHKALAIASYVRRSARYNLQTQRMPKKAKDFARWFLEESDTGYCVHFATAATVLLKAAGIPARYVTGYMVQVEEDVPATVTGDDAHAWVEYWVQGFGWTVLECTPPALVSSVPQTAPQATNPQPGAEATTPDDTQPANTQPVGNRPQLPGNHGGVTANENHLPEKLLWALLWIALAALSFSLLVGQRLLRLQLQQKRLHHGQINQQILAHWEYISRQCHHLHCEPNETLLQLAEKAKFSQYTLTTEELAQFDAFLADARQQLKQRHLLRRFWDRWILVLY